MNKFRTNLPLTFGMLLLSSGIIADRFLDLPHNLRFIFLLLALPFEIWGVIRFARSPEMKNSKLRRFKLKLIGRG